MPGLERDPRGLMKARMRYQVAVAIRHDKRQKEARLRQDDPLLKLDRFVEASRKEIQRWIAKKQVERDMKRNKKKAPTCKQLGVETGNIVEDGRVKEECGDFAHLSSEIGALEDSANLKLNESTASRTDNFSGASQERYTTAPVQSPEIDKDIDREKRVTELRAMLHSCVQSRQLFVPDPLKATTALLAGDIPEYIPDTPRAKLLYLERLQAFGPIPENTRLLHRVYIHLNPVVEYKPADFYIKTWTEKHRNELYVAKDINAAEMLDARKAHSIYSTFTTASDELQRTRDNFSRRRANEEAVVRGNIMGRQNAKKPTARRKSIKSSSVNLLPQRSLEDEQITTKREESINDVGSITNHSETANGVDECENMNGGVIRDLSTDVDELITEAPALAEEIVEDSLTSVSANNGVIPNSRILHATQFLNRAV
ncbi:hypothetical protein IFR05_003363 [Cadophora sp. M221]|nr:hypothetical protein IFR05_003363 [Cadophora sp. M221]